MKISILEEQVRREGEVTIVTLTAEVRCSDPREFMLINGGFVAEGYATCYKEDKFDELLGRRLARSRAYKTLYKKVNSAYKEAIRSVEASLRISDESMNKYIRAIDAQDRDIDRLINGVENNA